MEPTFERYDSYTALPSASQIVEPSSTPYHTPASKRERDGKKSDKKRKRENPDMDTVRVKHTRDQDSSDTPALHTGLTGGLKRMLSGPDFDRDEAMTPLNPDKKRSKKDKSDKTEDKRKMSSGTIKSSSTRHRHEDEGARGRDDGHRRRKHRHHCDSSSSGEDDHRRSRKAVEYRTQSVEPRPDNQMVTYHSPAELFLSFVNKGPDSERGLSINKALKRYHREQEIRGDKDDDKDLWKGLRVRKNERGEIVLFV